MPCRAWRFTRASWSPPAPGHQDLVPCGSRHSHGSMAQQPRCTEGHSGAVAPGMGSSRLGWAGPEACWRGGLRGGPGLGGRCLRGQMHPGGPALGPPAGLDAPGPRPHSSQVTSVAVQAGGVHLNALVWSAGSRGSGTGSLCTLSRCPGQSWLRLPHGHPAHCTGRFPWHAVLRIQLVLISRNLVNFNQF